ncbi:unnamed protein product [Ophioblennius macclurei]
MFSILVLAVLCASCLADGGGEELYSFSKPVGAGCGDSFATDGEGIITGIRLWEVPHGYITGLQVRYFGTWTSVVGRRVGNAQEMELREGERIIQMSGKYRSKFIYQLYFVTNRGRFVVAGQPTQSSFNRYPRHDGASLKMLSGRVNGFGITSLGAHWG